MGDCERCGAALEAPLVLRTPEGTEERGEVLQRRGETLCADHFEAALQQLAR